MSSCVTNSLRSIWTWMVLVALVGGVQAHFTLQGSREQAAYSSNQRFYPIQAAGELRPEKDCLNLPARTPRPITPGANTFAFEIGNGASHVGPCTAQLINLDTNAHTTLPEVDNCVSLYKAYSAPIPSINCPRCVLKVNVRAEHLGPNNPEFYDSCLDVSIAGNGGTESSQAAPPATPSTYTPAPPAYGSNPPTPPAGPTPPAPAPSTPAPPAGPAPPSNPAPPSYKPTPTPAPPSYNPRPIPSPPSATPTPSTVPGAPPAYNTPMPSPRKHRGKPRSRIYPRYLRLD